MFKVYKTSAGSFGLCEVDRARFRYDPEIQVFIADVCFSVPFINRQCLLKSQVNFGFLVEHPELALCSACESCG